LQSILVINFHAAGIDVGSKLMVVAYTDTRGYQYICKTGSFTSDLQKLVGLLQKEGITTVAMEVTGVYWISLYELLEDAGIHVTLINPGFYNNPAPKTDEGDSRWLHQYHSCNILRNSHIAPELYRELRSYIREQNIVQTQKSQTLTRIQGIYIYQNEYQGTTCHQ
jgi:hypothetical protein